MAAPIKTARPGPVPGAEATAAEADRTIRPLSLSELIGQRAARANMQVFIEAAKKTGQALDHVATYGSLHTEVIATESVTNARRWVREADASVVLVNASSRFSDGGELGLGAEIGISTTKLHAFGPMGLEALTTQKFVVYGAGETRHAVPPRADA